MKDDKLNLDDIIEESKANSAVRDKWSKSGSVYDSDEDSFDSEGEDYDSPERYYHPIRQRREYRSGCLGGIMYFTFICCVSLVLACFCWMAVSDVLALNGDSTTATVYLPSSIFTRKTVEEKDASGNVVGTKKVSSADIEYVSEQLKQAGLIDYKWLFELFCKISNADVKIDAGEYELKGTYDYRALVKNMQQGTGVMKTVSVTIPEGYSMYQIFHKLEENGVASTDDLYEAAANATFDYSFLEGKQTGDASRLEGYLFPDTYEFYVGMNPSSAIKKFLDAFNSKISADMFAQAEKLGYSFDEIINIASIIEKEAGQDDERANIASVIYNRLKDKMTLGIDSTILYLYPEHEGAPNAAMLAEDSPYNTRVNYGLPPTPISNPGLKSINAALNPTTTRYYYFAVESSTGLTRFFHSFNEFTAFVAQQNYD